MYKQILTVCGSRCQWKGMCVGLAMVAMRMYVVCGRDWGGESPGTGSFLNTATHFHWFKYCTVTRTITSILSADDV